MIYVGRGLLRSSGLKPVPRMVAVMGLQGLAHSTSAYLQGWRSCNLSGQSMPVFDYPYGENWVLFISDWNPPCSSLCPLALSLRLL